MSQRWRKKGLFIYLFIYLSLRAGCGEGLSLEAYLVLFSLFESSCRGVNKTGY